MKPVPFTLRGVSLLGALVLLSAVPCAAQDNVDGFVARVFSNVVRRTMPYRLFIPENYNKEKKYPLVLWLHGAGGAGSDNLRQIQEDQILGTHVWTSPENQERFGAFVVAPQSMGTWTASGRTPLSQEMLMVLGIVDSLQSEFSIDPARLYVAGQSAGAFGVWNLIGNRPQLFAAAIAVCGGGNPSLATRFAEMPIWVFHGDRDGTVPVDESRRMVEALRKSGGKPRYAEYRSVGHDVWKLAFADPDLPEWLFSQHK